ncbi:MAG: hypothetical protein AB7O67_04230 [Vicinamibacterales bacterium]
MKVLLSVLHFGLLRNFEPLVLELATRGHQVLLMADEPDEFGGQGLAEALAARPGVRWVMAPSDLGTAWFPVARKLRQGIDYLRFLEPRYHEFPKLAARAAERTPRVVTRLAAAGGRPGRRLLAAALDTVERGMPRLPEMDALLARERPDVALFGSVTHPRAAQAYHLRSARAAAVPTGVTVYSWDHLSSKALIRDLPDGVFVWNDVQRREAVELHGIPADRVVVTGAQVYDQWFGRQPGRDRATFLAAMGLPADRALILYVCSALTPDPRESRFVRRWLEAIRASDDPGLANAAVIIRPHPERRREWQDVAWPELGPVLVTGANPITADAKADYFDALAHAGAVVGLVTSAFLEAAIAGRPVLTVLPPDLRPHQEGMLHFRYLLEVEGGLLKAARTLPDHVADLSAALAGDQHQAEQQRRFLTAFVRPAGLDRPATPVFADAVEALGRTARVAAAEPAAWRRALAAGVIRLAGTTTGARLLRDDREAAEEATRHQRLAADRRAHRAKWRRHRRQKLAAQVQWKLKRVRELVTTGTLSRHDR